MHVNFISNPSQFFVSFFLRLLTVNPSLVSPLKPLVKILNATEKKKEKKKIAFLKTHKCSSTTIQNILFRYAYKHKLNVVLPKKGNLIGYPHGFTQKSIENTDWFQAHVKPDIFCMHTKWSNFSAIQEFMGGKLEKMASLTSEVTEVKIDICLKRTLNLAFDNFRGHRVS